MEFESPKCIHYSIVDKAKLSFWMLNLTHSIARIIEMNVLKCKKMFR